MKSVISSFVIAAALSVGFTGSALSGAVEADQMPLEFAAEAERLVEATSALFAELEQADIPEGPKPRMVIGVPQPVGLTLNGPADEADRPEMRHLRGYRVSWYPVETLLGTVDFVGTYDNGRNLVCGYVTWDLDDPADTRMVDLQTNFVDLEELGTMPHGERHVALIEANCAFGEIEPNFALSLSD